MWETSEAWEDGEIVGVSNALPTTLPFRSRLGHKRLEARQF